MREQIKLPLWRILLALPRRVRQLGSLAWLPLKLWWKRRTR